MFFFVFFFSSRRRHTRLQGDWSSDVCSSDLGAPEKCQNFSLSSRKAVARHSQQSHRDENYHQTNRRRSDPHAPLWQNRKAAIDELDMDPVHEQRTLAHFNQRAKAPFPSS